MGGNMFLCVFDLCHHCGEVDLRFDCGDAMAVSGAHDMGRMGSRQ